MRISRIYQPTKLSPGIGLTLTPEAANHLTRVLRLPVGASLKIFNGEGGEYFATLKTITKREVTVTVENFSECKTESPLKIHLGQGISRGEKMDFVIQKATELGVTQITPLITKRCEVKLTNERWEKRLQHWQAVAMSACEQCGRDKLPIISQPQSLLDWLARFSPGIKLVFHPTASQRLSELPKQIREISLLIGPEGGFDETEVDLAIQHKFISLSLGPRILRTETAAAASITALQFQFGDMN